jgi:uncharacterized protein (TIGR03083 family)
MIDRTTARTSIDEETARSVGLLRGLPDWGAPTRLAGWTVGDLARHLVGGQAMQADAWRHLAAGDATTTATAPDVTAAEPTTVTDAIVAANAALGAALEAVSDEQVAEGVCAMPYGTLPAFFVLLLATMEAGVHRSDLSAAVGEDDTLSPTTIAAAAAVLGGALPMLGAAGDGSAAAGTSVVLRAPGLDLAAVRNDEGWSVEAAPAEPTTTISGSASDVLLFALGRRPASSLEVAGDAAGAERFKSWFPGP